MLGFLEKKIKVEVWLPDDIMHEILVRLPMDSLLRCRVVCKSWNSLIKSSAFIFSHVERTLLMKSRNRRKKNEKDDLLLLFSVRKQEGPSSELFMLDCNGTRDEYTKRRVIPISDMKAIFSGEINLEHFDSPVGTCNGLVYMVFEKEQVQIPIIWNPCVRKVLVLPRPSHTCAYTFFYKLGYDSHNKDFKLMQIVEPKGFGRDGTPHIFRVFSLLGGSWRDLNIPVDFKPFEHNATPVETCGVFHWFCGGSQNVMNEGTFIVTFDLSTELFGRMQIPDALRKHPPKSSCKLRYGDCFALLAEVRYLWPRTMDLWVMREYGVAESWTRVVSIRMPDSLIGLPVYVRKNKRVLLGTMWDGLESFDRKRKHVKYIVADRQLITLMDPFFESLVLLDRSDALSY